MRHLEMLGMMSTKVMPIHGRVVEDHQENRLRIEQIIIPTQGWWIQETPGWTQDTIHDMNQDKDQVKDAWLIMKAHEKEEDQEVHLLGHEVTGMVNP